MELKEFVKGVLTQITDAVKESQEDINNGAIICPTNYRSQEIEKLKDKNGIEYVVKEVEFDVSLYTEKGENYRGEASAGIKYLINVQGKASLDGCNKDGNTTRIRFKIPLVLPSTKTNPGFQLKCN